MFGNFLIFSLNSLCWLQSRDFKQLLKFPGHVHDSQLVRIILVLLWNTENDKMSTTTQTHSAYNSKCMIADVINYMLNLSHIVLHSYCKFFTLKWKWIEFSSRFKSGSKKVTTFWLQSFNEILKHKFYK